MTCQTDLSICMDDLSFGFKSGHPVLRDVNLAIRRGERVAVMGASGSGKTTLLKLMAGLRGYRATSGNCFSAGHFAMVFQQPLLLNHMTVRENIRLPALLLKSRERVNEVARILDIGHLLDRYPFQLSGGQQRRVSLARALAYPDAHGLLMDEPFTGLDEPLRERILVELQAGLNVTGLTCILSTHSPMEAAFLSDRIIFLGNSPAAVTAEHVVRLTRGDRLRLLDKPEFFDEVTSIRKHLNDRYRELDIGVCLGENT